MLKVPIEGALLCVPDVGACWRCGGGAVDLIIENGDSQNALFGGFVIKRKLQEVTLLSEVGLFLSSTLIATNENNHVRCNKRQR